MKKTILFYISSLLLGSLFAQNTAVHFDGTDDFIQTTYNGISGTASRTMEAWIKTSANGNPSAGGTQKVIMDYGTFTTGGRFTLNMLWGNALRIEVGGSGLSGQTVINDGNWHHVAVVYNDTATLKYRLLVDGVLDTAGNISTPINTGSAINFVIGRRIDNTNYFNGSIDDIRFYNFAKNDTQISNNRNKVLCLLPIGLTAYYRLEDGTANVSNTGKITATDNSNATNNGTLNNFSLSGTTSNWVTGPLLTGGDTKGNIDTFVCYSYKSPSGLNTWSLSGTYSDKITNTAGCDSVLTIKLTIGKKNQQLVKVVCDSFITPSGQVLKNSGVYNDTIFGVAARGCDSIYRIILEVRKSVKASSIEIGCDSAWVWGKWRFNNQTIDSIFKSAKGCDSLHSIDVRIIRPSFASFYTTICDSFVSLSGKIYHVSGTYFDTLKQSNSIGCDSIISWVVTINKSTIENINAQSCDSFVSTAGIIYKTSGQFQEHFKTTNNCDSIINLNITINSSNSSKDTLRSCNPVLLNNQLITANQWVNYTLQTVNNCDSLVSTWVEINEIDTALTISSNLLTAKQINAEYQWLNCANYAKIAAATAISYSPSIDGNYAVEITLNNCKDTSTCYNFIRVGVQYFTTITFEVYPNPASTMVYVKSDDKIEEMRLLNSLGQTVLLQKPSSASLNYLNIRNLEKGLYLLQVHTHLGNGIKTIVVE